VESENQRLGVSKNISYLKDLADEVDDLAYGVKRRVVQWANKRHDDETPVGFVRRDEDVIYGYRMITRVFRQIRR
jgi:hypothetical protein